MAWDNARCHEGMMPIKHAADNPSAKRQRTELQYQRNEQALQRHAAHHMPKQQRHRGSCPRRQQPVHSEIVPSQAERLHQELLEYADAAVPTAMEQQQREAAFRSVAAACKKTIGEDIRVERFGSAAVGLELRSSDIDIVIMGFMTPDSDDGGRA